MPAPPASIRHPLTNQRAAVRRAVRAEVAAKKFGMTHNTIDFPTDLPNVPLWCEPNAHQRGIAGSHAHTLAFGLTIGVQLYTIHADQRRILLHRVQVSINNRLIAMKRFSHSTTP